jgi:hypothetical protein
MDVARKPAVLRATIQDGLCGHQFHAEVFFKHLADCAQVEKMLRDTSA